MGLVVGVGGSCRRERARCGDFLCRLDSLIPAMGSGKLSESLWQGSKYPVWLEVGG